jgi:hypothetical protein
MEKKPQFVDVADLVGMNQSANYRGMAVADFDNNGTMDLIVTSLYRNPLVFKNELTKENNNHWIGLSLISNNKICNRMALGSKIWLTTIDEKNKEFVQMQESNLVNGFSAQHDPRIHFGFPVNQTFKSLKINWCNQITKNYFDIDNNKYYKIDLN